jgi:D-alanyl-D-alanine carboxypeptidase
MIDASRRKLLVTAAALAAAGCASGPASAAGNARIDAAAGADFNGVVLVARRGRTIAARAHGVADAAAGRRMVVSDRFAIGSASKWLTTVAVMKLVDAGKLDIDAPIGTWLGDALPPASAGVPLRCLLNNTSGIPNGLDAAAAADPAIRTAEMRAIDAVRRFCAGEPVFAPGARFDYQITNWTIVTAIIEAVTGQVLPAAMDTLVFGPLRLTSTSVSSGRLAVAEDAARAYRSLEPPVLRMQDRPLFVAAGGGYASNAPDLAAALHQVFDGQFVSAKSREAMLRVTVPEEGYALGGRVRTLAPGGALAAWETGRVDGYRCLAAHRLETQTSVIVLNNTDMEQARLDAIGEALFAAFA